MLCFIVLSLISYFPSRPFLYLCVRSPWFFLTEGLGGVGTWSWWRWISPQWSGALFIPIWVHGGAVCCFSLPSGLSEQGTMVTEDMIVKLFIKHTPECYRNLVLAGFLEGLQLPPPLSSSPTSPRPIRKLVGMSLWSKLFSDLTKEAMETED